MGNTSSSRSAVSTLNSERYAVERREKGQDCSSSEDSCDLDREDSRDLDVYCGELSEGQYHGRGTLRYARSDPRQRGVFEGDFVRGKRSGKGKLSWTNGTVYYGDWKDDRLHGTGVLELPSGLKYEGEFQHNKFHGQGTLRWKNGKHYVGSWKDNLRSGTGVLTYPADDSRHRMEYTGEWSKGMRHGQGVMRWTNGALYEGEWNYGKRDGFGKHTFPSRQVYIGTWKKGLREGKGTRYFPNGDRYVGEWQKDKKHGQGFYVFAHGRVVPKFFEEGEERDDAEEIRHDPQSLQVYCIEAIAQHDRLVEEMDSRLPPELAAKIRAYRENEMHVQQQPSRFFALVHNMLNRFSNNAGNETSGAALADGRRPAAASNRLVAKFGLRHDASCQRIPAPDAAWNCEPR